MKWGDIAGLGDAKELLRENIALPLALPELFTGIRRPVKVRRACTALRFGHILAGAQGGLAIVIFMTLARVKLLRGSPSDR